MAKALECPACGARHNIDTLPDARTFRCDRCGQVLKVPDAIDSLRSSTAPAGRPADAPTAAPAPPPRRGGSAATGPRVSATAAATVPAAPETVDAPPGGGRGRDPERAGATAPSARPKPRWYWRVAAWIVAVPIGLLITGWPALQFDLLKKDDLLDVFVGSGASRYTRLLVFAAAWALVTALVVQLLVEGGRWWAARRRSRATTRKPVPV